MKKLLVTISLLLMLAVTGGPAPSHAAGLDRGIMSVEFLYAIEFADGRADKLRQPVDIFFDRAKKELYIVDPGRSSILVFNDNGMFLQEIKLTGSEGAAERMAVDGKGRIYAVHSRTQNVSVLDYKGEPLEVIKLPEVGGQVTLTQIATGKDGEVYALKSMGGIVRIDPDRMIHEDVDITGNGPPPNMIYGMTIDSAGRFLFTDMRPYSVVIFDPKAKQFKRFGTPGVLYGQLTRPIGVTSDEKGHICVTSTVTNKVTCYDKDGNFIEDFGMIGDGYGSFYMPNKIISDGKDRIFVLENTLKRVQAFRVEYLKEKEVMQGSAVAPGEPGKAAVAMQLSSRQ